MTDAHPIRLTVPRGAAAPSLESDVERILETEAGFVESCLPFNGMTAVPASYDHFARMHFRRLRMQSLSWPDVCPAYALAWLTHAAYGPELDETSEWELHLQWQDLHGLSNLHWHEVRGILRDAWDWLSRRERERELAGAA
jgi:hypothetical protein